jgi:hypothetical protein
MLVDILYDITLEKLERTMGKAEADALVKELGALNKQKGEDFVIFTKDCNGLKLIQDEIACDKKADK